MYNICTLNPFPVEGGGVKSSVDNIFFKGGRGGFHNRRRFIKLAVFFSKFDF